MSQAIPDYLLNLNAACPFDGYLPYDILFVFIMQSHGECAIEFWFDVFAFNFRTP